MKEYELIEKIVMGVLVLILGVFTYFAFFAPQPCDGIDNVYLACRLHLKLHPISWVDILGLLLFYGGFLGRIVWSFRPTGADAGVGQFFLRAHPHSG
jgi:hypothetical protein